MDVNETYRRMLSALARLQNQREDYDEGHTYLEIDRDDLIEMLDSAKALNNWLCRGGFLPTAWEKK